jgi:cell division protein FtsX
MIAAAILGAGVIAVIGNTIRLEILNRRGEIEVTKIVGGSNGFVRRPFLYAGILYGLGGALLAWGIAASAIAHARRRRLRRWRAPTAAATRSSVRQPQELGILIAGGVIPGMARRMALGGAAFAQHRAARLRAFQ